MNGEHSNDPAPHPVTMLDAPAQYDSTQSSIWAVGYNKGYRDATVSAAPELLETAKAWLRLHEQGMASREAATELWTSGQVPCAMEALRAAIAKAEGRS